MTLCNTLKSCEKCDCEKPTGLAAAIGQPEMQMAGTVREVPAAYDDCGCVGGGGLRSPNHGGGNVNHAANTNDWVRVVDLADEELGYMDKDGQ